MSKHTPLFKQHQNHQAKLVDFGGWEMPLHYGSQVEEHHAVRQSCGIFDVSHMTIIDVSGRDASAYLSKLLANDIARLTDPGQALYTCMLNEQGGVIDDLIAYFRDQGQYRLVVNAATREKDIDWLGQVAEDYSVTLNEQADFALLAVQGPDSARVFERVAEHHGLASLWDKVTTLKPFTACDHNQVFVARTGYTGEMGYEIMLPAPYAEDTWKAFVGQGARPCGLGSRDTLRIEAGFNLYGNDMDESISPLESGLAWTVSFDCVNRDFIGRAALEADKAKGGLCQFIGVMLCGRGMIRGGYQVITAEGSKGVTTSGTFSPTLNRSIGFVRIEQTEATDCQIMIREKEYLAKLCPLPFVRNGMIRVDLQDFGTVSEQT